MYWLRIFASPCYRCNLCCYSCYGYFYGYTFDTDSNVITFGIVNVIVIAISLLSLSVGSCLYQADTFGVFEVVLSYKERAR